MAKDKLTEYSATNASNDVLGDISVAEGMLPSAVNNAIREQMTHLKNFADGTDGINVLSLEDDDGSHAVKLQAPSTVSTTVTYTLPGTDGTSGYVLTTNGSGALSWAASLSNVVEDTSPQLGGNLDTNGNDINFGDNDKATFGDAVGGDLSLHHDGSNSYIIDNGTGDLVINTNGNAISLNTNGGGEYGLRVLNNGAVNLYHDNALKLATTATGCTITGNIDFSGILASNGSVQFVMDKDNNGGEVFVWGHNAANATTNELMRLTSAGNLLVGRTNASASTATSGGGSVLNADGLIEATKNGTVAMFNRNTTTGRNVEFRQGGSIVGNVSTTASGTTYNTTSDIRLKTDIEPLAATDKLMAMNPVSYAWKVDPDGPRSMGFIAQQMREVMPEAVSTGEDDDAMMSMDYGRITPILVSALQDAHRKIEDLESRIAAMENN